MFHFPKINHERVKSARKVSRTELLSDRRGSADVVPFRSSLFRPPPSPRPWPGATPPSRQLCGKGGCDRPGKATPSCTPASRSAGPVVFWIVVGTIVLLGMWSAATATYFAFRDDVLTRLIARQAEMQYAYEDRIAELRSKVDRARPAASCSTRNSSTRSSTRSCAARPALESRATALGTIPDDRRPWFDSGLRLGAAVETPVPDLSPSDRAHRDLRGAAGSRSAAGIARPPSSSRTQISSPRFRASTTCWSACRPRSFG